MTQLIIYEKKNILRVINVHSTFIGHGKMGPIRHEFEKLALSLEPTYTHVSIT